MVEAIVNGTVVWVTNRLYHKDIVPPVSGMGWLIYCTHRGLKLFGSFAEWSPKTESYRAKLLGLLTVYMFFSALKIFYKLVGASGKICYDNQGTLFK